MHCILSWQKHHVWTIWKNILFTSKLCQTNLGSDENLEQRRHWSWYRIESFVLLLAQRTLWHGGIISKHTFRWSRIVSLRTHCVWQDHTFILLLFLSLLVIFPNEVFTLVNTEWHDCVGTHRIWYNGRWYSWRERTRVKYTLNVFFPSVPSKMCLNVSRSTWSLLDEAAMDT